MNTRFVQRHLDLATSTVGVIAGLCLALATIAVSGAPVVASLRAILDGAFGGSAELSATVAEMVPLIVIGLAWILASSGGLFNVGLDGQIVAGGIAAGAVAIELGLPHGLHLLLPIIAGIAGGIAWAGVAGGLWAWRGVNIIVSTLMLNFIALELLSWIVRGPLKQPGQAFPHSSPIPSAAKWPQLVASGNLHYDLLLALLLVVVIAAVMSATTFGLRLRATAANPLAARSAGIASTSVRVKALLASGALAGLVGSSLVLGNQSGVVADGFNSTYGYDGIAVALVARNSPWGCIPAALLFGALRQGGGLMEARLGVSSSLVYITQGIVIVFVAGSALLSRRLRYRRADLAGPEATASGRVAFDEGSYLESA